MDEEEARKAVNKYYWKIPKWETHILNLDRFYNKVEKEKIKYTIIVNSDTFEINYLMKDHLICKR